MADSAKTFIILPLGSKTRINIKGSKMTQSEDGVSIFDAGGDVVAFFPNHSIIGVFDQASGNTTSRSRPKAK
jgi:hypothetical protein